MNDAQYNLSPFTDQWPSCSWAVISPLPVNPPPVYMFILNKTFSGMEHPFDHFRTAVLAVLPPRFLRTSSLAEHETLKRPWLGVCTQQPKHQCVINIVITLNPATRKEMKKLRRKLTLFQPKPEQVHARI